MPPPFQIVIIEKHAPSPNPSPQGRGNRKNYMSRYKHPVKKKHHPEIDGYHPNFFLEKILTDF